jgi:hypothetical protein
MKTKSITFPFARLEGFRFQPNETEGKGILEISSPLTPALAELLGCKEMLYDPAGFSHEFLGSISLPLKVTDLDLILKGDAGKYADKPTLVHAFKVSSESSEEGGTQLEVSFRAHLGGDLIEAFAFAVAVNKAVCKCSLTAKQGELFAPMEEADAEPEAEPAGTIPSVQEMKRRGKAN